MSSFMSTEQLLESFPMFGGCPRLSSLDDAGSIRAMSWSTSDTSESLEGKSASKQDGNSRPTTAGCEPTGPKLSFLMQYKDDFECQHRRRGSFLNHTPRDFEMRSLKLVEVYQPSRAPSRASIENYSRPRISFQTNALNPTEIATDERVHEHFHKTSHRGKKATSEHDSRTEIGPEEAQSPASGKHRQVRLHRRSVSLPATMKDATDRDNRSSTQLMHRPPEKKRQRRLTPFKLVTAKHQPLETRVLEHQRKASIEAMIEQIPKLDPERVEDTGTSGTVQKPLDSQIGGPIFCTDTNGTYTPRNARPPSSAESRIRRSCIEPIRTYPIDELDFVDEPPVVPERSPQRLTNPQLSVELTSTMSVDAGVASSLGEPQSPGGNADSTVRVHKRRIAKRVDAEQVDGVGSSYVGKDAPIILSHSALVSRRLQMKDLEYNLNYFLRHTGPVSDSRAAKTPRKKNSIRLFSMKQKNNSLAARVGSVEGSPHHARRQTSVPEFAREKTTSGGIRYLEIYNPSESNPSSQNISTTDLSCAPTRKPRHISLSFTEEMLNPLASPQVERFLSEFKTPRRSITEPIPAAPKSPRSPKRAPKSPKRILTSDHPLLTRVESTRARKLRDLQRVKRKPLPSESKFEQHRFTGVMSSGDLPTPAHTPEPMTPYERQLEDSAMLDEDEEGSEHDGDDDDDDEGEQGQQQKESQMNRMTRIEEEVSVLQRQNTELTAALARIVGLEVDVEELSTEDVLCAYREKVVAILEERVGGRVGVVFAENDRE